MLFNFLIPSIPLPFPIYIVLLPSSSYVVNTLFLLAYSQLFKVEIDEKRFLPVTLLLTLTDFASLIFLALISPIPYLLYRLFSVSADLTSYLLLVFICVMEGAVLAHISSLALVNADRRVLAASWISANTASTTAYMLLGGVFP
ncbi:hypothetical protein [Archaeoglobus sp.]